MKQTLRDLNIERHCKRFKQMGFREMKRAGMLPSMPQEGTEYEDYIQALLQSEPPYEKHYSRKRRKRVCRE